MRQNPKTQIALRVDADTIDAADAYLAKKRSTETSTWAKRRHTRSNILRTAIKAGLIIMAADLKNPASRKRALAYPKNRT
jgi:hypothetical protein